MVESRWAKALRWIVKFVFIGCYAAFMWASIHHVAYFFNNFEEGATNGISLGSYVLAASFDLTALITTIAVMFFRKNMSRGIQFLVWGFILAIAVYSYVINWEYTIHFQGPTLTLEPTGATAPVFDQQGNLHYVPVMVQNQELLKLNPLLASGFVLFSLIYSVVAEFFGSKPPTLAELQAQKHYLEETQGIVQEIRKLEGEKGPGLVERAKRTALELKGAVGEVTGLDESPEARAAKAKKGGGIFGGLKRNKELLEQMRAILVSYGWKTVEQAKQISLEEARLFLVSLGMWDAATDEPTELAASLKLLRTELQTRKLLTIRQIGEERDMEPAQIQARYAKLSAQLHQEQEHQEEEAAQAAQAEAERQASAQEDPRREDEEEVPGSQAQHEMAGWMTLEEVAEYLRAAGIKKTPEAMKNWLRPDANAPRRFEPNEWMTHISSGKRVILVDPAAALRITRALRNQKPEGGSEGARTRKKGDSNPNLPAVTAAPLPEEAKMEAETGTK